LKQAITALSGDGAKQMPMSVSLSGAFRDRPWHIHLVQQHDVDAEADAASIH